MLVKYQLQNVAFADGGTASGHFTVTVPDEPPPFFTLSLNEVYVVTTVGSQFSGNVYNDVQSWGAWSYFVGEIQYYEDIMFSDPVHSSSIVFQFGNLSTTDPVRLTPSVSYPGEVYQVGPDQYFWRTIVSGYLIPEIIMPPAPAVDPPSLLDFYYASRAVYIDNALGTAGGNDTGLAGTDLTLVLDSRQDIIFEDNDSWMRDGFFAQVFEDTKGNLIFSFEGSIINPFDPSFNTPYGAGTRAADARIAIGQAPVSFLEARQFVDEAQEFLSENGMGSKPIYVTGHSLGGAVAQNVAFVFGSEIAGGVTFGAPGDPLLAGPTASENVVNYVCYGDPVGLFGDHFGTVKYVGSPLKALSPDYSPVAAALYHPLSHYAVDLGLSSPTPIEATEQGLHVLFNIFAEILSPIRAIGGIFTSIFDLLEGQRVNLPVPLVGFADQYDLT